MLTVLTIPRFYKAYQGGNVKLRVFVVLNEYTAAIKLLILIKFE